jgi:hypothetical protein
MPEVYCLAGARSDGEHRPLVVVFPAMLWHFGSKHGLPILGGVEKTQHGDLVSDDLKYGQVAVPAGPTPDWQIAKVGTASDRSAVGLGTSQSVDRSHQKLQIAVRVLLTVLGGIPKPDFAERFKGGRGETYLPLA